MFLDTVLARNPRLIDCAADLHRTGAVEPDTYVLDLDAVEANAALLAKAARRQRLGLWFVAKQIGRNPELVRAWPGISPGSPPSTRAKPAHCTGRVRAPEMWATWCRFPTVHCQRCSPGVPKRSPSSTWPTPVPSRTPPGNWSRTGCSGTGRGRARRGPSGAGGWRAAQ